MRRLTTSTNTPRHARRVPALLVAALLAGAPIMGCSGGASGPLRVEAVMTSDGSFDSARIARLVLAVDGDGPTRQSVEVPFSGGFGNGVVAVYESRGGKTLVLAAVALDAGGARVASGVADPVVLSATVVPIKTIVLSSAGRVDGGTAPRDMSLAPDL